MDLGVGGWPQWRWYHSLGCKPVARVIDAGKVISRITPRYKGAVFPACHGVSIDELMEGYMVWGRGEARGTAWIYRALLELGLRFDGTLCSWYCMWYRAPA